MTWQPIETARRDGREVILFQSGRISEVFTGRYSGTDEYWLVDGWRAKPTHWMPLPEPPNTRALREAGDDV